MLNILTKLFNNFKSSKPSTMNGLYIYDTSSPSWSSRDYQQFAEEAFKRNVIANRCIELIFSSSASIDWLIYDKTHNLLKDHPILKILHHPNPIQGGAEFFESLYAHKLISGNAYILANKAANNEIKELYLLRPDRVQVIPGKNTIPEGYLYKIGNNEIMYRVDEYTGASDVLHLKSFNPLNDWYGLSKIESAAYSIDLHNESSMWNKALLENGARPSGALIVKSKDGGSTLTDSQFERLRNQFVEKFTGTNNAGRPLLLEGGLEWKEMSYSPKDMDFLETKNSAARDIALALGVPPQMLGIKGDNTYSNMQEARFAFWEETVLPLVDRTIDSINNWFNLFYKNNVKINYDINSISALSAKQDKVWQHIEKANFMTINEKRQAVGLARIPCIKDELK